METYIGYIKSPQDALIVLEACRRGLLNRVQRRLSTKERTKIKSGSIFAWDEGEAGMRRWTDGRTWSPSRVLGSFLTYRELDMKQRQPATTTKPHSHHNNNNHHRPYKPNSNTNAACTYKTDGLIKQSFSICTATHQKLHLISYYSKADVQSGRLQPPSADPALKHISIPKGLYPELNPLDTSGGHSATLLTMRPYPPSLSASPVSSSSSDEEHEDTTTARGSVNKPNNNDTTAIGMLVMPPPPLVVSPSPRGAYLHTQQSQQQQHQPLPPPPLSIQDIAINKLPFSEDQRQLNALRVIL